MAGINSPLQEACGASRKEMVDLLLAAGADPNHMDSINCIAMHTLNAPFEDARDVVCLLMKAGFTFDARADDRGSKEPVTADYRPLIPGLLVPKPFSEFAIGKLVPVAEAYARNILRGFETRVCEDVLSLLFHFDDPLVLARQCCERGYLGILQFLEASLDLEHLRKRGELSSSSRYSDSLLHVAAYFSQVHVARFLILERGFGVNKVVGRGRLNSPLPDAIVSERVTGKSKKAMVKFLLENGADPNYKNSFGYTAMGQTDGPPYEDTRGIIRLLLESWCEGGNRTGGTRIAWI